MKTYLVDFENVKSKGLVGIDRLTEDDHVIIFYSENSDTISFDMHCMVMQAKAEVDYMKVRVGGKNALDFQLSTLLGYLVAEGDNSHIFVISNDRGFDKLHDFWENTFDDSPNCKVFRTSNISSAINYARYNAKPPVEEEEPETDIEFTEDTSGESYTEESKTIEIDIDSGDAPEPESAVTIPDNAAGKIIAAEQVHSTPDYVEEQSVTKSISHPKKPVEIAVSNTSLPRMPKAFAPGVRHPMLLASNESQAELYEPLFEEFLRMPAAKDKHALLADFMRGAPDEAVTLMNELILTSSSKSELHNMLQQHYDNDTSTKLYNMVKSNYYFLKRVLRGENAPAADKPTEKPAAVPAVSEKKEPAVKPAPAKPEPAPQEKPSAEDKPAVQSKPETENKAPAQEKPAAAAKEKNEKKAEKPADRKKSAAEKKTSEAPKKRTSDELPEPKKVDADMKKRLHELLDSKADADEFSGVVSVINASASRQQLYINMMQRFNRNRGRELYGIIKDEYMKFTAEERSKQNAKPEKAKKSAAKDKAAEKPAAEEKPAKQKKSSKSAQTKEKKQSEKAAAPENKSADKPAKQASAKLDTAAAEARLRELCGSELVDDAEFMRLKKIIGGSESGRKLYLAMIKSFGKLRGAAMYNAVKPEAADISAALSEDK